MSSPTNISVYIPTFDISLSDIAAAMLPVDISFTPTSTMVYETSMYYPTIRDAFTFIVDGDFLTLQTASITRTDASFNVASSTYVSGAIKTYNPQVGSSVLSDD